MLLLKKHLYSTALFLSCFSFAQSQQLGQATFPNGNAFSYFTIITDQGVMIRMDDRGKILEWGNEVQSLRSSNYYAPKLQPFMGRVEYYGNEADSAFQGKLKSIGTTTFSYYWSTEQKYRRGKLKSIGMLMLDYYNEFDNEAFREKIKFIGDRQLTYFSSPDMQNFDGRLKSIGNMPVTYYTVFDNRLLVGRLKTVGPAKYEWYTSADRAGYNGQLKSGAWRQNIGGITIVLR